MVSLDSFPWPVVDNNISILADYHTLKVDVKNSKRQVSIFAVSFSPDSKNVATGSDSQISVRLISLILASQNLCSKPLTDMGNRLEKKIAGYFQRP